MKYIQKMSIRHLKAEEIYEITSEQFLQIDKDTVIKKEKACLNKYELEVISKCIKLHIDNYKVLKFSKFTSYINLPKLKYNWNKYLLLGIVRSFFKNTFSIIQINKSNNYLNLEFKIRRSHE